MIAASVAVVALRIVVSAVVALAVASISLRLLGVRRGWATALGSAVLGWCLGGLLALGLSDWDWGADGLVTHTLAIAIPATMAVAVAIDLLASPGSLARAEEAGLVVAPRPIRSIRDRIDVFRRYRELLGLIRRHGFGPLLAAGGKAERAAEPAGVRLRRVLEEAGGVYVKIGQIAATRVDLLSPEICSELAKLQNRVPAEAAERIEPVLEAELAGPVDAVFAEFDWEPLAAASIGQTYRARLHSGEAVVVKIQRPEIERIIERDLAALAHLADLAERRTPLGRSVRSGEILGQFARSLRAELDFLAEADAMVDMTAVLGDGTGVRIPNVYAELCTRRVLVQERFEGFTVADVDELAASSVDRRALADGLLRSALEQVLQHGFFHADPHPGNVFVLADGTLGLIDFGAVGRLDSIQRTAVVDMMAGLVRNDVSLLRDGIERVADMTGSVSSERLERAIAQLMVRNLRPSGAVEVGALQELVPMLADFDIRLPGDLVLLSRTLVTLDGTLGMISPGRSIVAAALDLASPSSELAVVDTDAIIRDELLAMLPRLRRLPDRFDRIMTLAARGDLRVRHVVDEDATRILRTLVNRALLAAIGAAFAVASTVLLAAADAGPTVSGGTGLFEIFGYGGLLIGTVLLLRVVAAVARDGTT
ncbi:MAG TPA: AarF/UbiB family protein [Acidimicrobiales bacterium]|nr:AarF/UbiB family protein [Acidimicrobiales bacterium]